MTPEQKLNVLEITDYNLIANKDPRGSYDRKTRENLYWIIEKLRRNTFRLSPLEHRLFQKFHAAAFSALEEREKKVKFEVARYRLNERVKKTLKLTVASLLAVVFAGWFGYEFVLDPETRNRVDMATYSGLNRLGLVAKDDYERIRDDLLEAAQKLAETRKSYEELNQMVERMILNNKVTDNLKYIIKQTYNDRRTRYLTGEDRVSLVFDGKKIASYRTDPKLWYILGVIERGVVRVYYNDEEILEIETIFGRQGEETPTGTYEIVNKVHQPTWYKKERVNGVARVRAIPFGHPDHEIGRWWMGLKKLDAPVPGSYGIHGVNARKVNEFYKKNFDWRNGSAGCPNIQDWYLHFLAKVVPVGTRVNIVDKDKWITRREPASRSSSA